MTDSRHGRKAWGSVFFILSMSLGIFGCQPSGPRACMNGRCVSVEIAQTKEEVARGLQFRESLDQDAGMFFLFPVPDVYRFWMKDTMIPLDMIWADENRTIIFIAKNVPPCEVDPCPNYGPLKKALYVLEVNAGYTDKHGIEPGDKMELYLNGQ